MNSKLAPLSGVAFLALVIGGAVYGGEPPSEQGFKSAKELAAAYAAQGDKLSAAIFVMGVGLVFLVYFGSVLKTALDTGTAETSCLRGAASPWTCCAPAAGVSQPGRSVFSRSGTEPILGRC